jgi:hypothetical protein
MDLDRTSTNLKRFAERAMIIISESDRVMDNSA